MCSRVSSGHRTPLYVLALHSLCNSKSSLNDPVQLAAELINNRSDILNGYEIHVIWNTGNCDAISSLIQYVSSITLKCPLVGIIGPTRPSIVEIIASLTEKQELALINIHASNDLKFQDDEEGLGFQFSFSMLDSAETLVDVCLALIANSSWSRVRVLHDQQLQFNSIRLNDEFGRLRVNFTIAVISENYISLERCSQVHVIFANERLINSVLCESVRMNLTFPTYQFIFIIPSFITDLPPVKIYSCTAEELSLALYGAIILQYQSSFLDPNSVSLSGLSYSQFENLYIQSNKLDPNTPLLFDAMWALSLALNSSVGSLREKLNVSLEDYTHGDSESTTVISEHLMNLSFYGISGKVDFRESSGYNNHDVTIYQFLNNGTSTSPLPRLVAIFFVENYTLYYTPLLQSTVDFTCRIVDILTPPKAIATIVFIILAFQSVSLLIKNTLTLYFHNRKSVRASSYKLNQLAFIGCYFLIVASLANLCLSVYPDVIPYQTVCDLWHALNSFAPMGLTLIFGSLCVRTWRTYRIFIHFRKPGRFLSDYLLLGVVSLFLAIDLVMVVLWRILDPFLPDHERTPLEDSNKLEPEITQLICTQRHSLVYLYLLLAFNLILMVLCMVFAILTRSKYNSVYQVKNTLRAVYLTFAVIMIGFPIYMILLLVNISIFGITVRFMTLCVAFLVILKVVSVCILTPPLLPVIVDAHKTKPVVVVLLKIILLVP